MAAIINYRLPSGKFGKIPARNIRNTARLNEGLNSWRRKRHVENNEEMKNEIAAKRFTRAAAVSTKNNLVKCLCFQSVKEI